MVQPSDKSLRQRDFSVQNRLGYLETNSSGSLQNLLYGTYHPISNFLCDSLNKLHLSSYSNLLACIFRLSHLFFPRYTWKRFYRLGYGRSKSRSLSRILPHVNNSRDGSQKLAVTLLSRTDKFSPICHWHSWNVAIFKKQIHRWRYLLQI